MLPANGVRSAATVTRILSNGACAGHLANFLDAYNYAGRLKTLNGLTPFELICKVWTQQPQRFRLNPIHHMPGPNT